MTGLALVAVVGACCAGATGAECWTGATGACWTAEAGVDFLCLLVVCWEAVWAAARFVPVFMAGCCCAEGGMLLVGGETLFLGGTLPPWGMMPFEATGGVAVLRSFD